MRRPIIIYAGTVTQFRVTQFHAPSNDVLRAGRAANDNREWVA